jgi:hypothetical protein
VANAAQKEISIQIGATMQSYIEINPLSTSNSGGVEAAVFDSILVVRKRECSLLGEDPQSPVALRLASVRGELQRLLAGQRVRVDSIERTLARAVRPSPANSPEGGESGLATDPEAVEVGR